MKLKMILISVLLFSALLAQTTERLFTADKLIISQGSNTIEVPLQTNKTYSFRELGEMVKAVAPGVRMVKVDIDNIRKSEDGIWKKIGNWALLILGIVAALSALIIAVCQGINRVLLLTGRELSKRCLDIIDFMQSDFLPVVVNIISSRILGVQRR